MHVSKLSIVAALSLIMMLISFNVATAHEYSYKHYHNSHDSWDVDRYDDYSYYHSDYYKRYKRNDREREHWDWYYDDKSGPEREDTYYMPTPSPIIVQPVPPIGYERVIAYDNLCHCNIYVLVPIRQ